MPKKQSKNKILVVGDIHAKERLGYADYVEDGREAEKEEVFAKIVGESKDCDKVVFMGDIFNQKNNPSKVNARIVKLLTDIGDKDIYVLAGNHDKSGDAKTSIDFLEEAKMANWHIVTNGIYRDGDLVFCPYFNKPELGYEKIEEGSALLQRMLKPGKILFIHHAVADSKVASGMTVNVFPEIVLDREQLSKKYEQVFVGHIHQMQTLEPNIIVTGSIFNNEVGESRRLIWKMDLDTSEITPIELPGRGIYKVENPLVGSLNAIPKDSIVKAIITDPNLKDKVEEIKAYLAASFDAFILLEQYPNERKKIHFEGGMLEFTTEKLLESYAKERGVDYGKLLNAYNLIK